MQDAIPAEQMLRYMTAVEVDLAVCVSQKVYAIVISILLSGQRRLQYRKTSSQNLRGLQPEVAYLTHCCLFSDCLA